MKGGLSGQVLHDHGKTILEFIPGPVKIKDGLFLGDELAARDIEFIISNKVTHVINTVSRQVPNLWERFGIHYLSVNWTEKEQNIFDKKNNAINTIFQFIEEAMQQGESCLVHSLHGKSRSTAVMVAYLMKKYQWSMNKSLQLIASKKENLQIRNNYMKQIQELQQRMKEKINLSTDWKDCKTHEEVLLTNTLANSKPQVNEGPTIAVQKKNKKRISFDEKPVVYRLGHQGKTSNMHSNKETIHNPSKNNKCKSILKGFKDLIAEGNEEEGGFSEFEEDPKQQKKIINNINGNIVHVTVNNFITSEKKAEQFSKPNTRPYSSDQKQREKQKKPVTTAKKSLLSDGNYGASLRSPYDMKMGSKNASLKTNTKKEMTGGRVAANERPQSAKHRTPTYQHNKGRQDLMITNSSSSYSGAYQKKMQGNIKQDLFRRR